MKNKNSLLYISEIESAETLKELKEALISYIQNGECSSTKDRLDDIEERLDDIEERLDDIEERLDSASISI